MKPEDSVDPWACGTWEGAEIAQLRRDASRSFRENLLWLEETLEFAERLAKAPVRKGADLNQEKPENPPSG